MNNALKITAAMIMAATMMASSPADATQKMITETVELHRTETRAYAHLKETLTRQDAQHEYPVCDIPLSTELQQYVCDRCSEFGIDPGIVYGIMDHESGFQADAISSTNDYGLMQINACNFEWLEQELGLTDMLDPQQNIDAGVYIITQLASQYGDIGQALMAYAYGPTGAERCWASGIYDCEFSRSVLEFAEGLKEGQK